MHAAPGRARLAARRILARARRPARRQAGAVPADASYQARADALYAAAITHQGQAVPAAELAGYAGQLLAAWLSPGGPAAMILTIEGAPMPLNIDSVNAKAVLEFADRAGDKVSPPAGTVATATSSDPAVLGVGPARAGTDTAAGAATIEFPLTPAGAGTATLTVHATAADGTPLLGPDAATPITDAPPVTVTVNPGAAAAEQFTVPGSGPAPAQAAPAQAAPVQAPQDGADEGSGLGSAQAAQGQPGAGPDPQPGSA